MRQNIHNFFLTFYSNNKTKQRQHNIVYRVCIMQWFIANEMQCIYHQNYRVSTKTTEYYLTIAYLFIYCYEFEGEKTAYMNEFAIEKSAMSASQID